MTDECWVFLCQALGAVDGWTGYSDWMGWEGGRRVSFVSFFPANGG